MLALDAVTHVDDDCNHILLDSSNHTRLMVWRIQQRSLLIIEVKKSVDFCKYKSSVEESLDTIEQGSCQFSERSHRCFFPSHLFTFCCFLQYVC